MNTLDLVWSQVSRLAIDKHQEAMLKWANALSSGEYQQASGVLRVSETHFCCLGVLCDAMGPRDKWSKGEDERWFSDGKETMPSYKYPIYEILGTVVSDVPSLGARMDVATALAKINDGCGRGGGEGTVPEFFAQLSESIRKLYT